MGLPNLSQFFDRLRFENVSFGYCLIPEIYKKLKETHESLSSAELCIETLKASVIEMQNEISNLKDGLSNKDNHFNMIIEVKFLKTR